MQTQHTIHFHSATRMKAISDQSVDLVVTSPPYPMISMWDETFGNQEPKIQKFLSAGNGTAAFDHMHALLDRVWSEVNRVLKPNGFACINIGDAVRTLNGDFALYPNHARILAAFMSLAMTPLPEILWRKQTNAPNKFMGSGMLPAGAYVTLEHEFILVFRKGGKREFDTAGEKALRHESAFFWEERNDWFSDVWFDIKGAVQRMEKNTARNRSGAYPFEVPYRLINMYSVKGDTVLDPFLGTGTTLWAAMTAARNSVGYELDAELAPLLTEAPDWIIPFSDEIIDHRLMRHLDFVESRKEKGKSFQYTNGPYGFPVTTRQEMQLLLDRIATAKTTPSGFCVSHKKEPRLPIQAIHRPPRQRELFG
jgi:modification methylase